MHDAGLRIRHIHPTGETIRLLRADAGYGEQASWLIEDDESVIKVENGWKHGKTPDQEMGRIPRKRENDRGDR